MKPIAASRGFDLRAFARAHRPALIAVVSAGAVTAGWLLLLEPAASKAAQRVQAIEESIARARSETRRLREDLAFVQSQMNRYRRLESRGAFAEPDRFRAARALEAEASSARLVGFEYAFGPIRREPASATADAFGAVSADVNLRIEAFTDAEIWRLVESVTHSLPGLARIESVELSRIDRPDAERLAEIAAGEDAALAQAEVRLRWRTTVDARPKDAGGQS